MRIVNSYIEESKSFDAAAAADKLIFDLLNSGIFTDKTWFTDDETDGLDMSDRTVWFVSRDGSVSSSTFDETGEEIGWSRICHGSCFDRLYMADGQIRHTGRSYVVTPPDMIVICG